MVARNKPETTSSDPVNVQLVELTMGFRLVIFFNVFSTDQISVVFATSHVAAPYGETRNILSHDFSVHYVTTDSVKVFPSANLHIFRIRQKPPHA